MTEPSHRPCSGIGSCRRRARTGLRAWSVARIPPERVAKAVDGDVVQERRELRLPVPSCSLTHAGELTWRGWFPALRPVPVLLVHVPLGRAPSLHALLRGSLRVVRALRRYHGHVRLPFVVRHRLTVLPSRCGPRCHPVGDGGISRFSRRKVPYVLGVCDRARPESTSRLRCSPCCLPPLWTASAPGSC